MRPIRTTRIINPDTNFGANPSSPMNTASIPTCVQACTNFGYLLAEHGVVRLVSGSNLIDIDGY